MFYIGIYGIVTSMSKSLIYNYHIKTIKNTVEIFNYKKKMIVNCCTLTALFTEGYQIMCYFSRLTDWSHAVLLCPDKRQT